ncbi:MAG: DUF6062 family protein [Sphaerochaetaceae bacterium]|nr:DUF6062 family protein [Sphaerochaetaceae bacterium]MDC7247455.1 DUF6062 family protein [Sphaerochaetaceae bacterium]
MKYQLETIPVWDALEKESECPLCLLMKDSLEDALDYYLGSSVMNSETRVMVNGTGFCPEHWEDLIEKRSAQSLALLSHTFLQTTMKEFEIRRKRLKTGRRFEKELDSLLSFFRKREKGCLICDRMKSRLDRYTFTVVKLYQEDDDFKEAFLKSKGLCLHHYQHLLMMAKKVLRPSAFKAFTTDMLDLGKTNLVRLEKEVWWMTQKYKSENGDKPWNGCEDAQKRVVRKLLGEGRIFSSSR